MSYSLPQLVSDYISGRIELVEPDKLQKRLSICSSCEHVKKVCGSLVCGKCGCLMNEKAKHVKSKCPVDKDNWS